MNIGFCLRELAISFVKRGVFRSRDWIVWVAFTTGVFEDDAGLLMLLSGEMLELRDAGEVVIVGIVHDSGRLVESNVVSLMFELERPVREWTKAKVEVLVNGTCIDDL